MTLQSVTASEDFTAWYQAVHPRLRVSLVAAAGNAHIGHEVADEAMTRAWTHWSRLRTDSSRDGWVYRTALNLLKRRWRRERLARSLLHRQAGPSAHEPVDEKALAIHALVAQLSPRQREAVLLRHVADMDYGGIAVAMGIALGTVSATLSAAYERLRAELDTEAEWSWIS